MKNSPPNIPIEDDPCDVLNKAIRGMEIPLASLSQKSGVPEEKISSLLAGEIDLSAFQKIAPFLKLCPLALKGLPSYYPLVSAPSYLETLTSPFGHAGVNAYVIHQEGLAVVFDTGTHSAPILEFLAVKKLLPAALVITHMHHDHIAGIQDFGDTPVYYPEDMTPNESYSFGGIQIKALELDGHASPARAYFHQRTDSSVCIVGDAIFAGSIGGTRSPSLYQLALTTIRKNILTLPPTTILGTGHGPLTRIDLEIEHNPFLAN